MASFKELGLSEAILDALTHLGYDRPTPIQEETIPLLLQGRDVIGQAQTGTGKTAAFGLPLLDYVDPTSEDVEALVLTPTRELCIQVTQALRAYGSKKGVDIVAVFGGAPIRDQMTRLRRGDGQVVVGTVGRVMDLMSRHALVLDGTRYVVLDEADEMLDLGFLEDVETILSRTPSGRQTALFSATMPPPIRGLADKFMYDPEVVKVRAATLTIDTVDQYYVEVKSDRDKAQGARDGVMIAFKGGRERLLVATDIAARGLDISGVSHVINYDLPNSPEVYVHRIGRTGRIGREGTAITLMTTKQQRDLNAIRKHANTEIEEWSEQSRAQRNGGGGVHESMGAATTPTAGERLRRRRPSARGSRSRTSSRWPPRLRTPRPRRLPRSTATSRSRRAAARAASAAARARRARQSRPRPSPPRRTPPARPSASPPARAPRSRPRSGARLAAPATPSRAAGARERSSCSSARAGPTASSPPTSSAQSSTARTSRARTSTTCGCSSGSLSSRYRRSAPRRSSTRSTEATCAA